MQASNQEAATVAAEVRPASGPPAVDRSKPSATNPALKTTDTFSPFTPISLRSKWLARLFAVCWWLVSCPAV